MDTLIDAIAKRAEYYGLNAVRSQDETRNALTVTTPVGSMWWVVLTDEDDVIKAKYQRMTEEMEIIPLLNGDEIDTVHDIASVEQVENIFHQMVPLVSLDDLPQRPDIKALWTGTGLWFLIEHVEDHDDHLHILSKTGLVLTAPTGRGIFFPYKLCT